MARERCAKVRYGSEQDAVRALLKIWRKARNANVPVRAYLCPRCKGWHLTHQAKHPPRSTLPLATPDSGLLRCGPTELPPRGTP